MTPGTKITVIARVGVTHAQERNSARPIWVHKTYEARAIRVREGVLEYRWNADGKRQRGIVAMHTHGTDWVRGWGTPEVDAMKAARAL